MYPYILCPSCGFALGDKYKFIEEQLKTKDEKLINKRLTELGIHKICCRGHIIANVNYYDFIQQ